MLELDARALLQALEHVAEVVLAEVLQAETERLLLAVLQQKKAVVVRETATLYVYIHCG